MFNRFGNASSRDIQSAVDNVTASNTKKTKNSV